MIRYLFFFTISYLYGSISIREYDVEKKNTSSLENIILYLETLLEPETKVSVEIRGLDTMDKICTKSLEELGYRSLVFSIHERFSTCDIHFEYLSKDTISDLLEKYLVPKKPFLCFFNQKYNDFYLWAATPEDFSPSLVIIKYNNLFPIDEDKVVNYQPFYFDCSTSYFRASVFGLYNLARVKDYSLIYIDKTYSYLFFIHNNALKKQFISFKDQNCLKKLHHPQVSTKKLDKQKRPFKTFIEAYYE